MIALAHLSGRDRASHTLARSFVPKDPFLCDVLIWRRWDSCRIRMQTHSCDSARVEFELKRFQE
ncbi:hypothetical protein PVAG01_08750 [Phlyctema vagabunda]|uniref:Uncharacterized protein n=1 Tax=Phlyctema vagabunda TaxID=108571 RepID=A0ABR4PAB2_9HELO